VIVEIELVLFYGYAKSLILHLVLRNW